jgi:hypothetical protein
MQNIQKINIFSQPLTHLSCYLLHPSFLPWNVFLIPVTKPVSALIMSDSNGDDGSDGGNNGSGCNCKDYDDVEKAATPTVTPTAMAMVAATATEGDGRCNFSQLQWQTRLWQ